MQVQGSFFPFLMILLMFLLPPMLIWQHSYREGNPKWLWVGFGIIGSWFAFLIYWMWQSIQPQNNSQLPR